jgi:hypothetical protein
VDARPWRPQAPKPSRIRFQLVSRCSTITLVSASTGMKLVSPPQRGTTCQCRWSAIPAPATLGMLGGGQLGRFFVQAAHELGYRVWVLDPDPSPATIHEVLERYGFQKVDDAYQQLLALSKEKISFLSTRRCRHFLAAIAPQVEDELVLV